MAEHLVYLVLRGAIKLSWEERSLSLAAGTAVLIPPHCVFLAEAQSIDRPVLRRLRFNWTALRWPRVTLVPRGLSLEPMMIALADELLTERAQTARAQAAWLELMLVELARQAAPAAHGGLDLRARTRLAELVAGPSLVHLHSAGLARAVGLSHDYFSRCFRISYGVSPRTWLVQRRLEAAANELAASDEAMAVIAARWGFADTKGFSKQFRRRYGQMPSQWRRHHAGLA
ncbi:MAG: AraC family transcriptional regulator [Planctomycetota bacterium]|nr:AraC family transcriptional regulator [Planctomycetota bacterium]